MFQLSLTISSIEVHNLNPQWLCVKNILKFVRSHRFYNCHNIGYYGFFYSLGTIFFFFLLFIPCHIVSRTVKSFSKKVFQQIIFYCKFLNVQFFWCIYTYRHTYILHLWKNDRFKVYDQLFFQCSVFIGLPMLLKLLQFVYIHVYYFGFFCTISVHVTLEQLKRDFHSA